MLGLPEWAAQALVLAAITFGVSSTIMAKTTLSKTKKLLDMHKKSPERLDKIVLAVNDQTYYMKILAEKLTGEKILPPIHKANG